MSQSIISVAEEVENILNSQLADQFDNPFSIPSSRMYGVSVNDDGIITDLHFVESHPDIYDLLDKPASERNLSFTTFALVTTGWAAPLNADGEVDGAPSEHPGRRRVRLIITANLDGVASVLRFEDDSEDIVVDPGSATGALADALTRFLTR